MLATIFEDYKEYINKHCTFLDKRLVNRDVYLAIDEVTKVLMKKEEFHAITLEVLKYTVPSNDGVPWLLAGEALTKERISWLCTSMKDSAVFKLSKKRPPRAWQP